MIPELGRNHAASFAFETSSLERRYYLQRPRGLGRASRNSGSLCPNYSSRGSAYLCESQLPHLPLTPTSIVFVEFSKEKVDLQAHRFPLFLLFL